MPIYGDSLADWASRIEGMLPKDVAGRDWSMEVAIHLGLAWAAIKRLKASGVQTTLGMHPLIEGALMTAWRELLHIRLNYVKPKDMLKDVPRRWTLNRIGRIERGTDQTRISDQGPQSNPDLEAGVQQGASRHRRTLRSRKAGAGKPAQSGDERDHN